MDSNTPSTCNVWMILTQVMEIPKMHCLKINEDEEIDENESLKDYGADHKPLFSCRHVFHFKLWRNRCHF